MERFDERVGEWPIPFASVLLRSESASSSQIEHLTASARRIALADLGDTSSRNATVISRNVAAMRAAIELADKLDHDAILAMHRELGGGDDQRNAGAYRREWVWIGGMSPVTARFVAPHHDDVEPALDDLINFLKRTDIEPLTQAAVAHAQFETIHPFTDGNGRTGRALVSAILRHRGVTVNMAVPISSGLMTDTTAYFDALAAYRDGDPEPIVVQLASAAENAVANASQLREDVSVVHRSVLGAMERRTRNIEMMADLCATEPAFTIAMVTELDISAPTAYRMCERLVDQGLLRRERLGGRSDAWSVPGLTAALDDFARRAGKRTFN